MHAIATDGIRIFTDDFCSNYHVVTDIDDNQIGAFYIGASRYNDQLSILSGKDIDFVTIGPTDPKAMVHYVDECRRRELLYFYDPAYQIANFTPKQLQMGIEGAAIIAGNDYEIALIEQRLKISHKELVGMVPILITTLGSKGSIVETKKDSIHIKPAKAVKVVDPTGAGDAYRAGFVAGYLHNFDLATCGQMGSVAAVYTVEKYGTVTHYFTKKEFEKRYAENFGCTIQL
ncbi:hypothetical protein HY086_04105 [Candidatus Gottesmanbacteria bacterium]|nr:hypothetical protein [Candidatus Gottesmanbacteria bacterium]